MNMRNFVAMTLAAALLSAPAAAVGVFTVDFEDQAPLTFVGNPLVYPEASFTSSGSNFIQVLGSNVLCPAGAFGGCAAVLTVDFPTAPIFFASDVSFDISADNLAGDIGDVYIYRDGVLLATVDLIGDGDTSTPFAVDLSSFSEINQLVLTTTDTNGLYYDNFNFNIIVVDFPVPAPATLALFGLGAAALGLARRR